MITKHGAVLIGENGAFLPELPVSYEQLYSCSSESLICPWKLGAAQTVFTGAREEVAVQ